VHVPNFASARANGSKERAEKGFAVVLREVFDNFLGMIYLKLGRNAILLDGHQLVRSQ